MPVYHDVFPFFFVLFGRIVQYSLASTCVHRVSFFVSSLSYRKYGILVLLVFYLFVVIDACVSFRIPHH